MAESVAELIDRILTENPIGLSAAARLFGSFRQNKPTNPATIFRWCVQGVKLPDGRRVRLEHVRLSNRLLTSRAACVRFLEAQQTDPAPAPALDSPARRVRDADAAGRRLDEKGA
jgi:hypothetical protein